MRPMTAFMAGFLMHLAIFVVLIFASRTLFHGIDCWADTNQRWDIRNGLRAIITTDVKVSPYEDVDKACYPFFRWVKLPLLASYKFGREQLYCLKFSSRVNPNTYDETITRRIDPSTHTTHPPHTSQHELFYSTAVPSGGAAWAFEYNWINQRKKE